MSEETKKLKQKSKEYPAVTLNKAIEFVGALKDFPIGKPIAYGTAANVRGVKEATKSFKYELSAAKQFGLISNSGKVITFLEPGKRFALPTESEAVLKKLKMECFELPKLFNELIQDYKGKQLPAITMLKNVLIANHGIAPNAAYTAAQTFIDTSYEVGAVKNGILDLDVEDEVIEENSAKEYNSTDNQANNKSEEKLPVLEEQNDMFEPPLSIPFGNQRKAILYMPTGATKEDAEYTKDMILFMFKRLYGIDG